MQIKLQLFINQINYTKIKMLSIKYFIIIFRKHSCEFTTYDMNRRKSTEKDDSVQQNDFAEP